MKKILIFTLILLLSLTSIYASFNFGLDLGYGYDRIRVKDVTYESTGFSGSLEVGYDFNDQWGVRGTFTLSNLGKVAVSGKQYDDKAGLTYDFALDAVNPYYFNSKVAFINYYGFEMIMGDVYKNSDSSNRSYYSFGVNSGVEVMFNATDHFAVKGGINFSYMFLTSSKYLRGDSNKLATVMFPRAYIGALYSL